MINMNVNQVIKQINNDFIKAGNPKRAAGEKAYLKSKLDFFGVNKPFIVLLGKNFVKKNLTLSKSDLHQLAQKLWSTTNFTLKSLAIEFLTLYPKYLDFSSIRLIEKMIKQSASWAHLDFISTDLVGAILAKDRRAFAYLKKWSRNKIFWVRRASLLSQIRLFRKGTGDIKLFFNLAESMLPDKEFFIRKAVGWTLREMVKHYPDEVFAFIKKNQQKMSGLTFREGSRKLPPRLLNQL